MSDNAPGTGNADATAKVVPRALYYVAIDGTAAKDSVAYGELLEAKYGWKNLLGEFLQPSPAEAERLVDPLHPYLPIYLYPAKTKSKSVAVLCPGGREAFGKDAFWKNYAGEDPSELPSGTKSWSDRGDPYTTVGRHTALEKSSDFMNRFFLDPALETKDQGGTIVRQLVDGAAKDINPINGKDVFRADLLLVSSHGWLGGFMKGNEMEAWKEAQPADAQEKFQARRPYFLVGRAAKNASIFFGVRWIILAQCSTLNSATWPLWSRVLAWSKPGVRGILAYEEVSPGPEGSITIAKTFFEHLEKKTILEAWKLANKGEKWAAIVHKEALNDRMKEWRSFGELADTDTTASSGSYVGFLSSVPNGEELRDLPAPFKLQLEALRQDPVNPGDPIPPEPQGTFFDITPDVLDLGRASIQPDRWYRATLSAPPGSKLTTCKLKWIHIRPTYSKQFDVKALFQELRIVEAQKTEATIQIDPANAKQIVVTSSGTPLDSIAFFLRAHNAATLRKSGMEAHHSYLWPHVEVVTSSGSKQHDFKIVGLSYYGV